MVLADESMPDGFARAAHAHGQGQKRELRRALREFRKQQLVAAHAGEVVHIARLGHADGGMNQEVGFDLLGGAESQFHVGAVHRVAGLESDDAPPSQAGKLGTQFRGRQTQAAEIIM